MEEEMHTFIFTHTLPVFGVECFGTALIDEGRFSRMTGVAPGPPVLRYKNGEWLAQEDWVALIRHQLNAQPGAWVSSLVNASERHIERAVSSFDASASPERIANGLCELYGVMAPPILVLTLLDELLERRMYKIFEHAGVAKDQYESWLNVFRYPEKKTASMKEREAFFSLATFVRKHSMDQSTRRRVGAYTKQYGYLGFVTPVARPLTFTDMLHRVAQLEDDPKAMHSQEEAARAQVLTHAEQFMNNQGLGARERDAVRAYRDVAYWQLRKEELWALIQSTIKPGVKHLAQYLNLSQEQLLSMRVEELSGALINKKDLLSADVLDGRTKKKFSGLFVEDLIEAHWT